MLPRIEVEGWKMSDSLSTGILKVIEFIPILCVEFLDRDEIYPDKNKFKEIFPLNDP